MDIRKWIVAHFSPTGGTKKVADAIAAGFATPIAEVDLTKAVPAMTPAEGEALMAVLPVYAGRVPKIALERLSAIQGRGHKAVAVVVYGNREFDDGLLETKNALEAQGFTVIAGAAFIAEHSIVRSVAAGRPDVEDEKIACHFGADIMAKPENSAPVTVPGNHPYVEPHGSAFHPVADEGCVSCGLCAEGCPVGAIPMDAPNTTDNAMCINCLRCMQVCPVGCRSLPAPFLDFVTKLLSENAAGYKKPTIIL